MAQFRINYNKVVRQANEIKYLSDDLDREIDILENLLYQIKREWFGPASNEFQKQLTRLIVDMKKTKCNMYNVSGTIKNTAYNIQKTDEKLAAKLAQDES